MENNQRQLFEREKQFSSILEHIPVTSRAVLIFWVILLALRFSLKELLGSNPDEHLTTSGLKILLLFYRLLSLFLVWLFAFGLGNFLRRKLFPMTGEFPPVFFSLALGLTGICYLTFFFLIRFPFRDELLLITALLLIIITLRETEKFFCYLKTLKTTFTSSPRLIDILLVLAFLILLMPPLLQVFTPPYSWDALTYHLTVPRIYLDNDGFVYIPLNIYSNMPMNVDLLFLVCLRFADDVVAKLLHFSLGIFLVLAMINFSRRHLQSWRPGILAGILFITNPMVNYEFGVAFIDVGMAFFMFMAFYAAVESILSGEKKRATAWLVVSAIFCGFLAGAKYTGIYASVAIFALFLFVALYNRKFLLLPKTPELVQTGIILFLMMLVFLAPWLVKNQLLTHNPVYPMLYKWHNGKDWTLNMAQQLIDWQHNIGYGRSLIDYLLLFPRIFIISAYDYKHFAGPLCPAILVSFIVALFFQPRQQRPWFWILLIGFLGFFIPWSIGVQQVRFLIPALPLLALASAIWISREFPSARHQIFSILLIFLFTALGLFYGKYNFDELKRNWSNLSMILGKTTRSEFLSLKVRSYRCFKYLEKITPKNEKILLLYENHGYYLHRPFLADGMFEASYLFDKAVELQTAENFARWVHQQNIKYVVVNHFLRKDLTTAVTATGFFSNQELNQRYRKGVEIVEDFINQYLNEEYSHYGSAVYRLLPEKNKPDFIGF